MHSNKMKLTVLLLAFVFVLPVFVAAEGDDDKVGSVAFKFLNLHFDARGAALGGLASQASGAEAVFWNPAGLASASGIGVTANITQWIVDTQYMSAGVALPLAGGVVGVSFISVDYGQLMKSGWAGDTEFIFEANQGAFSASDAAMQLSYAKSLSDKFSVGGTVKSVTEKIDTETISGLGFDVGTQFNTGFNNIRLGAVISNFGADIVPVEAESESDISLPMTFQFGITGQAFGDESMGLVAGVNVTKMADMAQRFAFNGEFSVAGTVKLRGSYTLGTDQAPITVGAGVNLMGISADLGMTLMTDFDPVMRISIGAQF